MGEGNGYRRVKLSFFYHSLHFVKSQEKSHEKSYEKSYEKSHEKSYEKSYEKSHGKSHEKRHEKSHEKSREKRREKSLNKSKKSKKKNKTKKHISLIFKYLNAIDTSTLFISELLILYSINIRKFSIPLRTESSLFH